MKLSAISEHTVAVSRWFHSMTVLTKNECFNCSVLQCSTAKLLLFFDVCLSKMFVVSQFSNLFIFTWHFSFTGFRNTLGGIAGTKSSTILNMTMSLFEERRFSRDDSSND